MSGPPEQVKKQRDSCTKDEFLPYLQEEMEATVQQIYLLKNKARAKDPSP